MCIGGSDGAIKAGMDLEFEWDGTGNIWFESEKSLLYETGEDIIGNDLGPR